MNIRFIYIKKKNKNKLNLHLDKFKQYKDVYFIQQNREMVYFLFNMQVLSIQKNQMLATRKYKH